ncbi:MAG: class I SAM-dependent methyltransferase [Anaerolineae bacterium]
MDKRAQRSPPSVAWTGRLSLPVRLMVNASNLLARATGAAADTAAMKTHVRLGYEAAASDHVTRYDELGEAHYRRIAEALLQKIDSAGRNILDVGCGTGILAFPALARGAAWVVGIDLAARMLHVCRDKAITAAGFAKRMALQQGDAEALPFAADAFDIVLSSMVLGMVPDQARLVAELARVVRPGGFLALATHGPDHYWEANDAAFRAVPKRYVLGYRLEFWPRGETEVRRLLRGAGLRHVETQRLRWRDAFGSAGDLYEFYAATSSAWWLTTMPGDRVDSVSDNTRRLFEHRRVTQLTMDVILAHGTKPL